MFPYRNSRAERDRRMAEHNRQRKLSSTRMQVMCALSEITDGKLSYDERNYAKELCGLNADYYYLTPREKARVGNLFDRACRRRRWWIDRLPKHERIEALPGLRLVGLNRAEVRRLDREAGLARRAERKAHV
jgi:hypothetical protein